MLSGHLRPWTTVAVDKCFSDECLNTVVLLMIFFCCCDIISGLVLNILPNKVQLEDSKSSHSRRQKAHQAVEKEG